MSRLYVRRGETALVLVDIQERLAAAMPQPGLDEVVRNNARLLAAAEKLALPVAVSEQYPAGLGRTVPALKEAAAAVSPVYLEKTVFSLADEPGFKAFLGGKNPVSKTLILTGMEAHICVFQTVRALCKEGYSVHVPADAVLSRTAENRRIGLELCAKAGAVVTSTETVIFDLLERAGTDEFKALSKLLK